MDPWARAQPEVLRQRGFKEKGSFFGKKSRRRQPGPARLAFRGNVYFLKKFLSQKNILFYSRRIFGKTTPQKSGFWVGLENVEALIRNIFPVPYARARRVYIVRYCLQPYGGPINWKDSRCRDGGNMDWAVRQNLANYWSPTNRFLEKSGNGFPWCGKCWGTSGECF